MNTLRAEKKLDRRNNHIIDFDLKRNNIKATAEQFYKMQIGSYEWKRIERYVRQSREAYTAFNNMLRFSESVPNNNFDRSIDDHVVWDLSKEYGYEHTPNRTSDLYERRAKELAKKN